MCVCAGVGSLLRRTGVYLFVALTYHFIFLGLSQNYKAAYGYGYY